MSEEDALLRDEKGRLIKGTPPGPGRPKGSISIKDKVRQYLQDHPEEVEAIVEHFVKSNRELMWQMLEGRPQQDVVSDGEKIVFPIYGGDTTIHEHNSDKKDIQPEEKNTGG